MPYRPTPYRSPAALTALVVHRAAHARLPVGIPGTLMRMALKLAVLAPLVLGAFALRYAAMLFQP
ncbi:hypothetical protein [Azorhizobium doebereinerae]|uniref:hypothetical protein n=1 Tax=Azorhizobium doebereinerae TaxID=281091 RepID=UPI00041BCBFC|nr:hypothetical protein [Azorhizobium doebereinerae]